ncbi:LysM peptidoglycan-binding domain-containing protein [Sphingobacterium lactis]|uniref:lytic transglycosylase domain-containing protein n=1 Tax=Sphingobacterium lactis TaxID=797291 RepID=UPI003F7D2731
MNKKISFLVTIGLSVFLKLGHAQEVSIEASGFTENVQTTLIGQIERQKESISLQLDSIKTVNGGNIVFTDEDVNIAQRIQRIQKTVPLEYNGRVKAYLDKYISRNYKPYMEKLLGLGDYYFPIYEQIFAEQGIPEEVKYLSVVESSLNPHTLSTSGALGPWQFIYGTAKLYHLSMDGTYDERKDVYSSTYAVTTYLKEAYDEFNDWLLALASYNCGRGCVRRAIQRSGMNNPTYWELSPFLPKETQNYIPKFVAMTYVLNHAELYGLNAQSNNLQMESKVMMLDRSISLDNLAKNLGISMDVLKEFNPAFKRSQVTASVEKPRRLVLPFQREMSDSEIYSALYSQPAVETKAVLAAVDAEETKYHRGQKGESQQSIAYKYGVTVQNLRAWNGLSANSSVLGRNLVVAKSMDDELPNKVVAAVKTSVAKKTSLSYVTHTVRKGDTLSDIVQKYKGSSVSRLKSDNNLKGSNLRIGQKLKVYKGNS